MAVVTMKQLLESGVHFGHQTRRWNPKMKKFIFTARNGIYIIDLQKTVKLLDATYRFVRDLAADGGTVLFVGTKKQAQDSIRTEAERCGMYFVNQRWLGGMLTNYQTISKRIARLDELDKMEEDGVFEALPKKEVITLGRQREKLMKFLGGIRKMKNLPDAIYVVDPRKERIVVAEARKLGIPVIAIVDTNCDPDEIDYIIPGNDDAIRAVKLITSIMANAIIEGRASIEALQEEEIPEEIPGEVMNKDAEADGEGEKAPYLEDDIEEIFSGNDSEKENKVEATEKQEPAMVAQDETKTEAPASDTEDKA